MSATPFDGVGLALSLATRAGQIATVASGWVGGPRAPRASIAFVGRPRLTSLAGGVVLVLPCFICAGAIGVVGEMQGPISLPGTYLSYISLHGFRLAFEKH